MSTSQVRAMIMQRMQLPDSPRTAPYSPAPRTSSEVPASAHPSPETTNPSGKMQASRASTSEPQEKQRESTPIVQTVRAEVPQETQERESQEIFESSPIHEVTPEAPDPPMPRRGRPPKRVAPVVAPEGSESQASGKPVLKRPASACPGKGSSPPAPSSSHDAPPSLPTLGTPEKVPAASAPASRADASAVKQTVESAEVNPKGKKIEKAAAKARAKAKTKTHKPTPKVESKQKRRAPMSGVLLYEHKGWKVYERERGSGVHEGDKYKVFVDTSTEVAYYSKTAAEAKGFQMPPP
ncbi:unnamed protein product [Durusdinium trenchii]|uniref:MBD domain-containing protein n=1 Tax=Durusdinium trenchii TaxID=1381693 RepID=A0ABP0LRW2_9DINO